MDVSLRLKFLRPDEVFGIICTPEQMEKMKKVVAHNGGTLEVEKREEYGVFALVRGTPTSDG